MELLRTAHELVRGRGHTVVQADLHRDHRGAQARSPPRPRWRRRSPRGSGSPSGTVHVKAKTNEGMGFIGRGEGLAVIAVATLEAR